MKVTNRPFELQVLGMLRCLGSSPKCGVDCRACVCILGVSISSWIKVIAVGPRCVG